ncbi:MAG: nicotinate-nucleotide adenylyltransferase [Candidatus Omnitrophota bacterium]|nr:MAG: nicotinate-nucleotide adenylyltransferase [Candidatus Omnitrophota bacterium]
MDKSANKRIGILGGTFNPVHNAHLHIAKQALKKLHLDKIIFIPAYIPPHKKIYGNITATDRIHMLRLAIKSEKRFAISLYEIRKKGKSYSIKTIRFLKKKYGKRTGLFFLIGADSLKGLPGWKDAGGLLKLAQFVVVPRPGFAVKNRVPGILKIDIPKKDISSTKIRRLLREKEPIKRFVPKRVYRYIKEHKLYTT